MIRVAMARSMSMAPLTLLLVRTMIEIDFQFRAEVPHSTSFYPHQGFHASQGLDLCHLQEKTALCRLRDNSTRVLVQDHMSQGAIQRRHQRYTPEATP